MKSFKWIIHRRNLITPKSPPPRPSGPLFSSGFNPIKPSEKMNKGININGCFKSVGKGFVCLLEDKCNYTLRK